MDTKKTLTALLGTAVILGFSEGVVSNAYASEGNCGNCGGKKGKVKATQKGEASCGNMKKEGKEATCGNMTKEDKEKAKKKAKKEKEMACAGPGGCGAVK